MVVEEQIEAAVVVVEAEVVDLEVVGVGVGVAEKLHVNHLQNRSTLSTGRDVEKRADGKISYLPHTIHV